MIGAGQLGLGVAGSMPLPVRGQSGNAFTQGGQIHPAAQVARNPMNGGAPAGPAPMSRPMNGGGNMKGA